MTSEREASRMSMRYVRIAKFFFQAEDGIRALTVTGVQTCALPISAAGILGTQRRYGGAAPAAACVSAWRVRRRKGRSDRSEERRVGKERRSRWSADH